MSNLKVNMKDVEKVRTEILQQKLTEIRELCTSLKNSGVSKNDALRTIKNVCLRKDSENKLWKSILGDDYNPNGGI